MIFYNLVWYFLIYAFLGWCLEVAYKAVTVGKFVNRGFLNGPVCPIYGAGMVMIIFALTPISHNKLFMFVGSVVVCSAIEWVVGFCLEKLFHAKWWDYSEVPFNLNGYICLKFSLYWGIAGVFVMDVIHPTTIWLVDKLPYLLGCIFATIFSAGLAVDSILTVNVILKLNREMRYLTELGLKMRSLSDGLGEEIFEGVSDLKVKAEEAKVRAEAARERAEEAMKLAEERGENFAARVLEKAEAFVGGEEPESVLENPRDIEIESQVKGVRAQAEAEFVALREEYEERFSVIAKRKRISGVRLMKAFPTLRHHESVEAFEILREQWRKNR